jgi:hexosaminidase
VKKLDIARHYYPPSFLTEVCAYISFWKQNTFHVHLSDNLFNNPSYTSAQRASLYSAFRINSPSPSLSGLDKRKNESYTPEVFEDVQTQCAKRGVTIIPEIEAPGHALVISQWKPELALAEDESLLNISHPETIPTMQTIWKEILPLFKSKSVHIGADEYVPSLSSLFRLFLSF